MNMWVSWVSIMSGAVTIAGAVPYLVKWAVTPVVRRMLEKQTKDITQMVNRRMTIHEQRYHGHATKGD